MKIILFENYKSGSMDLNNEIENHLSQFPYLTFSTKEENGIIKITFNKDVSPKFAKGLLDPFENELVSEDPLTFKISKKKNVDKFEEFNGKIIIENIEKVSFPDLNIKDLEVKVDSGATTSSIHSENIKMNEDKTTVSFSPLSSKYDEHTGETFSMPIHSIIKVQSSNGDEEDRPLIKTRIIVKGKEMECYLSLADRKELEYPVLLGKDVLSGKFLIKPGL